MGEDKVKLTTMLPMEIYKKIIELAYKLYGSRKGSIAQVICNAINVYYTSRINTHTHDTNPMPNNPPPNVYKTYIRVKAYIEKKIGVENPYEAPVDILIEGIAYTRGADRRTIKKWLNLFEKYHCIKWVSHRVVELM